MGVSLSQSLVALTTIILILYLLNTSYKEHFDVTPSDIEFQKAVDYEFATYYRPIEKGYLYLLNIMTKDGEFMKPLEGALPQCPPPKDNSVTFVNPATMQAGGAPGGWFYENASAYAIKPAQVLRFPSLDSDEYPEGDPCPKNPDLAKALAEWWWAQKAWVAAGRIPSGMIYFYTNSKMYGQTNSFRALPSKGAYDYIYTLNQMLSMGWYYISKFSSVFKNIDLSSLQNDIKRERANRIIEGFSDACCNQPSAADITTFRSRTTEIYTQSRPILNLLEQWKRVEKDLRAAFEKLNNGFSQENIKEIGLENTIRGFAL